ncbi:MAG: DNA-processing protein DprA [Pseudomonadota bacterium]
MSVITKLPFVETAPARTKTATAKGKPSHDPERLAKLRLARSQNVGPRTYTQLLRRFSTAQRALESLPVLAARGGRRDYTACPEDQALSEIEAGENLGAELLLAGDKAYPPLLAQIDPCPPVLWVIGDTRLFRRSAVGIVGARNASALGMRTARRLARELGTADYAIVSGMARGIDAAAHEAALSTGTIAVLAGGLDCPYPRENQALAAEISKQGLLVSEVPFGIEPQAKHFPRRNRLISGLSQGVVLVEAAARSGSLITARFALEQGREAMACPGPAEDPRAAGCNALIRDGAALIRHSGDVEDALAAPRTLALAEDGHDFEFDAEIFSDGNLRDDYDALADFDEEGGIGDEALADQIMALLGPHPVEIDDIARQCGVDTADLSLAILELDLAGRIELRPGGTIARLYDDG